MSHTNLPVASHHVSRKDNRLMELQHINVKLLLDPATEADLEPLIPIFHNWIQDRLGPELLLDIADYRHVYAGPGVVLIGHEANYSVDNTDNRLGVRYNRKAVLNGSNQSRLAQAAEAALMACQRLEADPRLGGQLRFNGKEIEIFVNDRLVAPNRDATRDAVRPELETFCRGLFPDSEVLLSHSNDPRRLFAVSVKASRRYSMAELLANLNKAS
jgi:hypothetical protein